MKFYAGQTNKTEFNTTASFIEIISKWFTLITARTPKIALGLTTRNEPETKYKANISFLLSVVELFHDIQIGYKKTFKPVQNGIIITISSIIELTNYLIHERGYKYVLTDRLTQDCVENVFSAIRAKHPIPNVLQFKQNLKLLLMSQYCKSLDTSSNKEDRGHIINFVNNCKKKGNGTTVQYSTIKLIPKNNIHIDDIELNILYNIAGYIISSIVKCNKICANVWIRLDRKSTIHNKNILDWFNCEASAN